jgi:NADH-quinone oxidoreductase subunit L
MTSLLQYFILIPFVGFVLSLLIPAKKENLISQIAFSTIGLHLICAQAFLLFWLWKDHPTLNEEGIVLFQAIGYKFFIDFYFDKVTAVYLFVGALLSFLITIYSRYYLHRERGYKRFFNTILFFYWGYTITIFSGNLETLFIGWEILGIASFLLIAFYRNRYLPVKNAVKVFSIYRFGDVGLLLAIWMSHHLWHENITFLKLNNYELVHEHLLSHSWVGVFISLMILISAAAKSAQLPFSSWLPRAMEGPTPSSAIFYGSLAVHLGVFLLLRTFPFWEHQLSVRILIGELGLMTSLVTTGIARVQSSVKSQIAYSSIAQIGIIFIEIAIGLEKLALFHFAGNAFLRTYQLLVSPSVVTYLIREQFYNFVPREHTVEDSLPK